jgi:amidase
VPLAPRDEAWHGLSVLGFVSRTVADSALLYEAVLGAPWVAAAAREPGRLRVAVSFKVPPGLIARVHPAWRRATEQTAELLRSLGHDVVERDPDYSFAATNHFLARYLVGIADDAARMEHPERLERRTRGMARLGRLQRPLLQAARTGEEADAARINAIFDDVDVVLTPALATPPPAVGRWEGRSALWTFLGVASFVPFNAVWNHVGNPAAAVPAGLDDDGLPLSVQLAGRPGGEDVLLSLSAQLEAARPWADRRPPVS